MREHRQGDGIVALSGYRAILFDVGGPLDLEFAWEMAVDGAIASACGMEGIRVDPMMVEQASEQAVAVFAPDVMQHMIDALCGGEPVTAARVRKRVEAMVGNLDAFQLRPEISGLLQRLSGRGLRLGAFEARWERLERAGIAHFFERDLDMPPAACILVGDRLDRDIAPAKARGMATIQFCPVLQRPLPPTAATFGGRDTGCRRHRRPRAGGGDPGTAGA